VLTEALDDLVGAFLKVGQGRYSWEGIRVDWIHPSYRDLVIDELASTAEEQLLFLKRVSATGVKLALSLAGGSAGDRQLPLMRIEGSWAALHLRCKEIASGADDDSVAELLNILTNAFQSDEQTPATPKQSVSEILRTVCDVAATRWDQRGEALDLDVLKAFHRAAATLTPCPTAPSAEATWEVATEKLGLSLDAGVELDPHELDRWFELDGLLERAYPDFTASADFRDRRAAIENRLFEHAERAISAGADLRDPESNEAEGRRLERLAETFEQLDAGGDREEVWTGLLGLAEEYKANGTEDARQDYEPIESDESEEEFDIDELFSDL
jgi:hypothetical protein